MPALIWKSILREIWIEKALLLPTDKFSHLLLFSIYLSPQNLHHNDKEKIYCVEANTPGPS
jgi:hypothetical protein